MAILPIILVTHLFGNLPNKFKERFAEIINMEEYQIKVIIKIKA